MLKSCGFGGLGLGLGGGVAHEILVTHQRPNSSFLFGVD